MTASPTAVLEHRGRSDKKPRAGGQLVVARVPQLAGHRGTGPDLVLRWGAMPEAATVDVVVHLHGFSVRGSRMNLVTDKLPDSGLDLADPAHPATRGRRGPTLLVLPRGHFYGGKSGRGYSFPALTRRGALSKLVVQVVRESRSQLLRVAFSCTRVRGCWGLRGAWGLPPAAPRRRGRSPGRHTGPRGLGPTHPCPAVLGFGLRGPLGPA